MMPKSAAPATIDAYIKGFPRDVQAILQKVRLTIATAAPDAVEAISYQMPTFTLNGTNLVHFAAWQSHIGFYATPSGNEAFKKELSAYQGAKGSVRFPLDEPIPYGLIKKIVTFRVKESRAASAVECIGGAHPQQLNTENPMALRGKWLLSRSRARAVGGPRRLPQ